MSIYPSVCLPVCLSTYLPIYLSIHMNQTWVWDSLQRWWHVMKKDEHVSGYFLPVGMMVQRSATSLQPALAGSIKQKWANGWYEQVIFLILFALHGKTVEPFQTSSIWHAALAREFFPRADFQSSRHVFARRARSLAERSRACWN